MLKSQSTALTAQRSIEDTLSLCQPTWRMINPTASFLGMIYILIYSSRLTNRISLFVADYGLPQAFMLWTGTAGRAELILFKPFRFIDAKYLLKEACHPIRCQSMCMSGYNLYYIQESQYLVKSNHNIYI